MSIDSATQADMAYPSTPMSPSWLAKGEHYENVDKMQLPYTTIRRLGVGWGTVVDKVQDHCTGAIFAHKILFMKGSGKRVMKERFQNEVKAIRRLDRHHHIIRLFATYTTSDTLGIIMYPVADTGDLDDYLSRLARYQRSPQERGADINRMVTVLNQAFGCLAAGLAFMREEKIRHKDIKPRNILVHQSRVIYTDFGLSFDSKDFENSMTGGPSDQTRKWAAPEVLRGKPRNSSSDVYSLGCVFMKIFATIHMPDGYNDPDKWAESMDDIHRLLLAQPRCEPTTNFLSYLIMWMTQRNPAQRYTAQAVWEECAYHPSFCCDRCYQRRPIVQPKPANATNYWTPWKHHRGRFYSCLMSPDGQDVLDTKWSDQVGESSQHERRGDKAPSYDTSAQRRRPYLQGT